MANPIDLNNTTNIGGTSSSCSECSPSSIPDYEVHSRVSSKERQSKKWKKMLKKLVQESKKSLYGSSKPIVYGYDAVSYSLNFDDCLSAKRNAWNEFNCFMESAVICLATGRKFNFSKYIFDSMIRNVDSSYTSSALTHKVFANMRGVRKDFSGVETPLFALMLVQPQPQAVEEVEVPTARALPSPTTTEQMLLHHLYKILPLHPMLHLQIHHHKNNQLQLLNLLWKINQDEVNAASKGLNAAEPTVFDDEEVTMTMAQIIIRMKAEKAKLLDKQIAQRLHDEEVKKAAENIDWNVVAEKIQERHLDNIQKYQSLKKKPVSIAQTRKNMIIYLKNMAGYKMEHFKGMTYDKVRPIFKREYKKVQTLFKPDKDVEERKKKRVAEETLLQESFKKLRASEVLGFKSTQEVPSNDPKEMSEEDVHKMLEIAQCLNLKLKPYRKMHQGINTTSSSVTAVGSRLMLLSKVDTTAALCKPSC
nr:hypothetical protein [Tanacetum cinerariifolium]